MPKVKVENKSQIAATEAFSRIKQMLQNDPELRKMDAKVNFEFNDQKMSGKAKGSQFEASMFVTVSESGTLSTIEVELPFMLTPVKGLVQNTLQKKLDAALS